MKYKSIINISDNEYLKIISNIKYYNVLIKY